MAFTGERPELTALKELEDVLHHLADELGAWRRRALTAEAKVGEQLRIQEGGGGAMLRMRELEEENGALRQRLEAARERLAELSQRLGFLEEQSLTEAGGGTGKHEG